MWLSPWKPFVKSRSLAKSAQDLRDLYKDKNSSFDKMAYKAEQSNLLGKSFHTGLKNQSSIVIAWMENLFKYKQEKKTFFGSK